VSTAKTSAASVPNVEHASKQTNNICKDRCYVMATVPLQPYLNECVYVVHQCLGPADNELVHARYRMRPVGKDNKLNPKDERRK